MRKKVLGLGQGRSSGAEQGGRGGTYPQSPLAKGKYRYEEPEQASRPLGASHLHMLFGGHPSFIPSSLDTPVFLDLRFTILALVAPRRRFPPTPRARLALPAGRRTAISPLPSLHIALSHLLRVSSHRLRPSSPPPPPPPLRSSFGGKARTTTP